MWTELIIIYDLVYHIHVLAHFFYMFQNIQKIVAQHKNIKPNIVMKQISSKLRLIWYNMQQPCGSADGLWPSSRPHIDDVDELRRGILNNTYLFSSLEPPPAWTFLQDLTLILGIFSTFSRRLTLLVDAPPTRHNTDLTPQNNTETTQRFTNTSQTFYNKKTLDIFSKYTFSRNHNIQGCNPRRHCL